MIADPDQVDAVAEWERLLDDPARAPAMVSAASDWANPQRTAYLRLLYRLVGETVRGGNLPHAREAIAPVLEGARAAAHPALARFSSRAEALLADPSCFEPYHWCDGGWVFEDTVRRHEAAAEIAAAMLDGRVGVREGSRRIAQLVPERGPLAPRELEPFVALASSRASAVGPERRKPSEPSANDAEPIDHSKILDACKRLVENGGLAIAR
jgi:hypothetical protein